MTRLFLVPLVLALLWPIVLLWLDDLMMDMVLD